MNCTRCSAPLPPDARFCRNCGALASINDPANSNTPASASSQPNLPPSAYNAPTSLTTPTPGPQSPQPQQMWAQPQQAAQQPWMVPQPQSPQAPQPSQFQAQAPTQQPYYQPTVSVPSETMQSTGSAGQRPQTFASGQDMPAPPVRRRRGRGLRITLITLVTFIIVLVGVWVFALRPYLHSLAQNHLDSALSSAVNQISSSPLSQAPVGVPLPPVRLTEDGINNFLFPLLNDPSSPVQNMHVQITSTEMRLDFTVFGFASDVTGVPTLVSGNLTVTNVSVGGIAGLVMSSDDLTGTLNNHLADLQAHLSRPITNVSLMDHELDITLG